MENEGCSSFNTHSDKECQACTESADYIVSVNFSCNRYISKDSNFCDAEIQTDIPQTGTIKIPNNKQYKNVSCEVRKNFIDKSVGNDSTDRQCIMSNGFVGVDLIKTDEQLIDLAGVSMDNFLLLCKRLDNLKKSEDLSGDNSKINTENRLLIFLIKMKTGLSFSAMSVLFSVHRTRAVAFRLCIRRGGSIRYVMNR